MCTYILEPLNCTRILLGSVTYLTRLFHRQRIHTNRVFGTSNNVPGTCNARSQQRCIIQHIINLISKHNDQQASRRKSCQPGQQRLGHQFRPVILGGVPCTRDFAIRPAWGKSPLGIQILNVLGWILSGFQASEVTGLGRVCGLPMKKLQAIMNI